MSQSPYSVRNVRFGIKFGSDLKVGTIKMFEDYVPCCYASNFNNAILGERKQILKPVLLIGD